MAERGYVKEWKAPGNWAEGYVRGTREDISDIDDVSVKKMNAEMPQYGGRIKGNKFVSKIGGPVKLTTKYSIGRKQFISPLDAWKIAKDIYGKNLAPKDQTEDDIYQIITGKKVPGYVKAKKSKYVSEHAEDWEKKGVSYEDNISLDRLKEGVEKYMGIMKRGGYRFVSARGESRETNKFSEKGKEYILPGDAWGIAKIISEDLDYVGVKPESVEDVYESITGKKAPGYVKVERENKENAKNWADNYLSGKKTTSEVRKMGREEQPSSLEDKLAAGALSIFFAATAFLTMQKLNVTGFAIAGMTPQTSNIGILVSILGIIGILLYKLKK